MLTGTTRQAAVRRPDVPRREENGNQTEDVPQVLLDPLPEKPLAQVGLMRLLPPEDTPANEIGFLHAAHGPQIEMPEEFDAVFHAFLVKT